MIADPLINELGAEEKQRVEERTEALVKALTMWAQRYPFVRTGRILTASLETAVALPRLPLSDALLAAQMILWIYGLDDVADERLMAVGELRRRGERWCAIAGDGFGSGMDEEEDGGNELTAMLLDMRERLVQSRLFEPLREYWTTCLNLLVEAMARESQYALEYEAHGPGALPTLEEYLETGIHSIGMPFWEATVLILSNDDAVLEQFEVVIEVIARAGAAMRLYNDVRTFDKEMREGGINAILIVHHELLAGGMEKSQESALVEARRRILRLADSHAERCYELVGRIETGNGQFEAGVSRLLALYARFYGHSERDRYVTAPDQVGAGGPIRFSTASGLFTTACAESGE
jgi:hypothetical protein